MTPSCSVTVTNPTSRVKSSCCCASQGVAVCCSVLQCVAHVAARLNDRVTGRELRCVAVCYSVLQCVAVESSKHHEPLPLECDFQPTLSLHHCNKQQPLQNFSKPQTLNSFQFDSHPLHHFITSHPLHHFITIRPCTTSCLQQATTTAYCTHHTLCLLWRDLLYFPTVHT